MEKVQNVPKLPEEQRPHGFNIQGAKFINTALRQTSVQTHTHFHQVTYLLKSPHYR